MLNNENSQNPLRAGYEELGGRTAMEAISAPSILGAAAGLPVFTGEGGTAVAKAVPEALAALGLPYETGTWTPILRDSVGEITYTYQSMRATYVRIGGLCFVSLLIAELDVTAVHDGEASRRPWVGGLPFGAKRWSSVPVKTNGLNYVVTRPVDPIVDYRQITIGGAYTGWKVGHIDPSIDNFLLCCLYECE